MSLEYINREELQNILGQLEQALHNHVQWHNSLIRTLVCKLKGDINDTKPKAHHHCLFGQWYYEDAPKKIQKHPSFIAIGESHQCLHQLAASLVTSSRIGTTIDPHDYDAFANTLERLRLEINSFKHEIEISLYTHDPLTGAINRADMIPTLRDLLDQVKRQFQNCTITMMDVDFFKKVNDVYGHSAGDKVLVSVAHYIAEHIRPYDKLFRYGGEEFLICMQQTELEEGYQRIEALREGLAALPLNLGRRNPIYITASFGVTALTSEFSVEECIDHADKALYQAKSDGRNCTRIYTGVVSGNPQKIHSI